MECLKSFMLVFNEFYGGFGKFVCGFWMFLACLAFCLFCCFVVFVSPRYYLVTPKRHFGSKEDQLVGGLKPNTKTIDVNWLWVKKGNP